MQHTGSMHPLQAFQKRHHNREHFRFIERASLCLTRSK